MQRLDLHRHVRPELGAVGSVQVGHQDRVPPAQQALHRPHLRRVELHVVAVEVVVLRGRAPPHLLRAALVGPVPGAEALVAVRVEHRHEQQHDLVQRALGRRSVEHLAQGEEAGVLALDLAGMDAALHQDHRQVACLCGRRVECAAARGHKDQLRPPFRRGAESLAVHRVRICGGKGRAQPLDLVVAAGADEAGLLGQRLQLRACSGGRPHCRENPHCHAGEQARGRDAGASRPALPQPHSASSAFGSASACTCPSRRSTLPPHMSATCFSL